MDFAKRLLSIGMFLLLYAVFISHATESDTEWRVVLYDEDINALVTFTPDSVTTHLLPNVGYQAEVIRASDDFRYAVGLFRHHYGRYSYPQEVTIMDLKSDEVYYILPPSLEDGEIFVEFQNIVDGNIVFSPDMTEVAVSYTSHDTTGGWGCCDSGGIIIVNLQSTEITHHLDIDATFNTPGKSTSWLTGWTSEGVWFAPRCWGCTPRIQFFYHLWNPDDDTVVSTNRYENLKYAQRVESTGELLNGENHIDYPAGGLTFPNENVALNVVSIYQPYESPPDTDGQVVYFDIENLRFERPRWIMGEQAFIVRGAKNAIVFRDGRQIEFDADWWYTEFLTMTSDGWLAKNTTTGDVLHYTVEGNEVVSDILYQSDGRLIFVNHMIEPLKEQLPAFSQDISPPDEPFCYGNMPSRLAVGDYATVIDPSRPLYITDNELNETGEIVYLELNTVVEIISEVECDYEVWLHVSYDGTIGWMVETYFGTYYLEPTVPPKDIPYNQH